MKKIKACLCCLCICLLAGCGSRDDKASEEYTVYYVDKDENKVVGEELRVEETETKAVLQALFLALKTPAKDASVRSAIPEGVQLESFTYEEHRLVLNFDGAYAALSPTAEVLSRAAIVRTLYQVDGVDYVAFNVAGEPLVNMSGAPVGYMTGEQFVDNAGDEINAYEKATLTLYFADASGTHLEAHTVEKVYNSNISLDKLVVEELIAGPEGEENEENGYKVIPEATQIVSVTTRDGTCYVNLDEGFLTQQGNVSPEVTIYAIVNSLVELSSINKVQISVNGNTDIMYMETLPLSQVFERNLEIMDNAQ
jgi:germination protein M